MNKIWLIAKYEYLRHVLRKRFLLVLFGMPLFIILIGGLGVVVGLMQINRTPIGVVDQAGYLNQEAAQYTEEMKNNGFWSDSPLLFMNQLAKAKDMLQNKKMQAYFVIPQGYPEMGQVELVSNGDPTDSIRTALDSMLQERLLREVNPDLKARILEGPDMVVYSLETDRQQSSSEWYMIMIPIFSGILFIIVVNTSGGYLLRAVVEEKENRTMEIILTSVSSNQLMSGKIFGNLSVGLTQLFFWFGVPILLYLVLGPIFLKSLNISVEPQFLILTVLTLIPAFVLVAALMAMLGATVTETQEAQQVAGLFTLPLVAPYWFMSLIMMNPNSAFSIGLSLFPLTAPVTLPLRAVFTDVPLWQSAVSIGLLILCAYAAIRMTGGVFRLGMLRYGKRLTFKEVIQGLRKKEAA
jgi:ABC-2 type transport system permease protein